MKYEKKKIKEHFMSTGFYRRRKGFVHPEDHTILDFIKNTCGHESLLLEIGGGSGYMLDIICSDTHIKSLYNCEIVPDTYKEQANENINLIGSDALNLPFKDNVFDYIIAKNLLHHLIGRTRKESKNNARMAILEFTRVIKDKGYIIVLEHYNRYNLFASMIYYITLLLSSFKIFEGVIVSFLTPGEIKKLFDTETMKIILCQINRQYLPKKYKMCFLIYNTGNVLFITSKF